MRRATSLLALMGLVLGSTTSVASAQQPHDPFAQPQPDPYAQPQPDPYAQPQPQPYAQPQPEPELVHHNQGRGREYGGHLIIPIWLGEEQLSVGFGVQLRFGWEFPSGVTLEINGGYVLSPIDDLGAAGSATSSDSLTSIWIGAGLRYSFFNPSALVPFVGAGIAGAYWSAPVSLRDDTAEASSGWTLTTYGVVGLAYEITEKIAIEGGAQINASLEGDVFEDLQLYVSPFIGGTFYY